MEIRSISVLGSGTMGHGIAQVAAQAGYATRLYDLKDEIVELGMRRIQENLAKGVEKGKLTEPERIATLARLSASSDLGRTLADADLVIEAVPEVFGIKIKTLREVDRLAPVHCIVASNTSSLSISRLASHLSRPQAFIGMHFFNPVHIMQLVEIVIGDRTDGPTLEAVKRVSEQIGKTSIVVKDSPGFATSRLGVALGLEAMRMLESGVASAEDIDKAMELGYRHPMGPLKLTDLVGLDVRLEIAEYLHKELVSDVFKPPAILRRMVSEGKLGKKSGQGFYTKYN